MSVMQLPFDNLLGALANLFVQPLVWHCCSFCFWVSECFVFVGYKGSYATATSSLECLYLFDNTQPERQCCPRSRFELIVVMQLLRPRTLTSKDCSHLSRFVVSFVSCASFVGSFHVPSLILSFVSCLLASCGHHVL